MNNILLTYLTGCIVMLGIIVGEWDDVDNKSPLMTILVIGLSWFGVGLCIGFLGSMIDKDPK